MIHRPGDHLADQPGQHQSRNKGELVRHFKDDENRRNRRLHHRAETGAHAAHGEQYLIGRGQGENLGANPAHADPAHGPEKQIGGKYAAASAQAVGNDGRDQFADQQQRRQTPCHSMRERIR